MFVVVLFVSFLVMVVSKVMGMINCLFGSDIENLYFVNFF